MDTGKNDNEDKRDGYNTLFCTPDLALQVNNADSSYSVLDNTKKDDKGEPTVSKLKELPPTPSTSSKVKDLPPVPSSFKGSSKVNVFKEMVILPKVEPRMEPTTDAIPGGDSVYYNESVLTTSKASDSKKESVSGTIPNADTYEDIPRFQEESKKECVVGLDAGVYYNSEAVLISSKNAQSANSDRMGAQEEKRVNIYTQSISLDTF